MISINDNNASEIASAVIKIWRKNATKEESDRFMKLMYETETISPFEYACYITGFDVPFAITRAVESVVNPFARHLIKAKEMEKVKPAA